VHVVDAATHRIVQSGEVLAGPDQVTFTAELAYLRHRGSETVLMVPLDELGVEGAGVPVVDFPGGQHPPGAGRRASRADSIVRAPGANAVLVANPADRMIYYYKEGMAAPMGGFRNYDREPRAVLVVDRSLKERSDRGVYETVGRLPAPGRYRVAFYLDAPRVVACFPAEVAPDPELERRRRAAEPPRVEPLLPAGEAVAGVPVPLRFRLTDAATGEPVRGLTDLVVLAYTTGNFRRQAPAPEVEAGVYEWAFTPPGPGSYVISLASPAARLPFHRAPSRVLRVGAPPPAPGPSRR
jgi:hypothetical protein